MTLNISEHQPGQVDDILFSLAQPPGQAGPSLLEITEEAERSNRRSMCLLSAALVAACMVGLVALHLLVGP